MTHSIWESIANTPWWAYLILVYVFHIGWSATKPHITYINRLITLPALTLTFSIVLFLTLKKSSMINISYWIAAAMVGLLLGWLHFRWLNIKSIKEEAKLFVPGSWSIMIIIILAFITQFYISYQAHLYPKSTMLNVSRLFIMYGLIVGLFLGRLIYSLRCIKKGPFLIPNPQLQHGNNS
jgi:hypothetical protein